MIHSDFAACRPLSFPAEAIGHGKVLIAFLLATKIVLAFPAAGPRKPASTVPAKTVAVFFPASPVLTASTLQSGVIKQAGTSTSQAGLDAIQSAIDRVHAPSLQGLAGALGLKSAQIGHRPFENSTIGMESISGLAGGDPDVAVKWRPPGSNQAMQPRPEPSLYLLSWDGEGWRASYLTPATDALTLQVLPAAEDTPPLFAVIIFRGMTATPYPVIFRFRDHHATLVWDGRSDSSLYTGYDYGSVQFEKAGNPSVPVMVATGRADPGLLVFPVSQEQAGRGFQAATAYAWKNGGYVPVRTEYIHNRDYTLYRFIAALHLHDFKTAYSLIDPAQFLNTKKPSLKLFRERIQSVWPEFTDDKIFEVPAEPVKGSGSNAFVLRLGHGKLNVYHPTFTSGPSYRLTGLKRTHESE